MSSTRYALCLAALSFGCSQQPSDPAPRAASAAEQSRPDQATLLHSWIPSSAPPGTAPSRAAPTSPAAPRAETRGTVRETMNAAGYTYLRMDSAGVDQWVATTEMRVAVGDQVIVEGGNVMRGFHSRTLDRTFDAILFAGAVRIAGAPPSPAAAQAPAPEAAAPSPSAPAPGARRGAVRETMSSGGYTYLRIEGGGASTWVAVPVTTLAVGDEVEVPPGNEMPGFHSRTLDRTFPQLTFASEARVVGAGAARAPTAPVAAHAPSALPPGHPPLGGLPPGHPSVGARPSPDGISH